MQLNLQHATNNKFKKWKERKLTNKNGSYILKNPQNQSCEIWSPIYRISYDSFAIPYDNASYDRLTTSV